MLHVCASSLGANACWDGDCVRCSDATCAITYASEAVGVRSITPAQRQRDATALIFGNVSDDSMLLLQPGVDLCEALARACGRRAEVSEARVMQRLLSAELTAQLNYGIPAAVEYCSGELSSCHFVRPPVFEFPVETSFSHD
jgi:hypothetical protein